MNLIQFAKDHRGKKQEIKSRYCHGDVECDSMMTGKITGTCPLAFLCKILANADKTSFEFGENHWNNTTCDGSAILSPNHTVIFSASTISNLSSGSLEESLIHVPFADLIVSGKQMDFKGLPQIRMFSWRSIYSPRMRSTMSVRLMPGWALKSKVSSVLSTGNFAALMRRSEARCSRSNVSRSAKHSK